MHWANALRVYVCFRRPTEKGSNTSIYVPGVPCRHPKKPAGGRFPHCHKRVVNTLAFTRSFFFATPRKLLDTFFSWVLLDPIFQSWYPLLLLFPSFLRLFTNKSMFISERTSVKVFFFFFLLKLSGISPSLSRLSCFINHLRIWFVLEDSNFKIRFLLTGNIWPHLLLSFVAMLIIAYFQNLWW